jgi:hypothetical protein
MKQEISGVGSSQAVPARSYKKVRWRKDDAKGVKGWEVDCFVIMNERKEAEQGPSILKWGGGRFYINTERNACGSLKCSVQFGWKLCVCSRTEKYYWKPIKSEKNVCNIYEICSYTANLMKNTNRLLLFREITAVYGENHAKLINTLGEQDSNYFNLNQAGTYSDN